MSNILTNVCHNNPSGQVTVLKTITSMLAHAMKCGEDSEEYFTLYKNFMQTEQRKLYLSSLGYLTYLSRIIHNHIQGLSSSLSNLSLGYTLKHIVEILVSFLNISEILKEFKGKEEHVEAVLKSFLTLQSIIIQVYYKGYFF